MQECATSESRETQTTKKELGVLFRSWVRGGIVLSRMYCCTAGMGASWQVAKWGKSRYIAVQGNSYQIKRPEGIAEGMQEAPPGQPRAEAGQEKQEVPARG